MADSRWAAPGYRPSQNAAVTRWKAAVGSLPAISSAVVQAREFAEGGGVTRSAEPVCMSDEEVTNCRVVVVRPFRERQVLCDDCRGAALDHLCDGEVTIVPHEPFGQALELEGVWLEVDVLVNVEPGLRIFLCRIDASSAKQEEYRQIREALRKAGHRFLKHSTCVIPLVSKDEVVKQVERRDGRLTNVGDAVALLFLSPLRCYAHAHDELYVLTTVDLVDVNHDEFAVRLGGLH